MEGKPSGLQLFVQFLEMVRLKRFAKDVFLGEPFTEIHQLTAVGTERTDRWSAIIGRGVTGRAGDGALVRHEVRVGL